MWPRVGPGPRLTSVQSSVFSPVCVTPVWAAWPAATRPAWTGHGPGRSLLSPLLTSQHTHHHTPKDTKKNSKMSIPMPCGWERERSQSGGVEASYWPECDGAGAGVRVAGATSHSILRCPEPVASVRTHSWGSQGPGPRYSAQAVPGSHVPHVTRSESHHTCHTCHNSRVTLPRVNTG